MANPLMLIHGYGSSGLAFSKWKDAFLAAGRNVEEISIGSYVTLNNEITVDDVAGAAPDFGPVDLDISDYDGTQPAKPALFHPFTTTLIEIVLNREPIPPVEIFQWLP